MPRKLKVLPPKDDEGVPPGVPPPNDGPEVEVTGHNAVNINRRSKLTVKGVPPGGPSGGPSPNYGSASGGGASGGASGGGASSGSATTGACVSFAETNEAPPQPNYLESLSQLEQRVCSIARDHLESSFDLSRSTGYLAWKAKNGM